MIYHIDKNTEADFGEVVPGLACSITDALTTGVIQNAGDPLTYENDLTSPSEVGDYIRDNIDALQAAKNLGQSLSKRKAEKKMDEKATSVEA